MRQLVNDQPVEQVGRLVDRQHHAVAVRLGECADAFLGRAWNDVLLLELGAGLEDDQRNLEGEIVLQVGADLLVCALGVAGDALQVLLGLGVVVNLEMIGRVDVPPEIVVADLVLAVVREKGRLCVASCRHASAMSAAAAPARRPARSRRVRVRIGVSSRDVTGA